MNNCCKKPQESKQINDLVKILRVIAEPSRLKILCLLKTGTKCVCEIQKYLELKQNLVSHHLKILKDYSLIDCEKKGQWKHYCLNQKEIKKHTAIYNHLLT